MTELAQTGDVPSELWASGGGIMVLGPTGILLSDYEGSHTWVGVPTEAAGAPR